MAELELRRANVGDAERLLEIYAPYVEKTAITFEDKVPSIGEFQNRILKTLRIYPYLVQCHVDILSMFSAIALDTKMQV